MPKRRVQVSKAATETTAGKVHELTNITVEEVSMVNLPANEKKFILTKAKKTKKGESAEGVSNEPVVEEQGGEEPEGIDLVAAEKAAAELKAKDAADALTTDAAKAAEELKTKDAADKANDVAASKSETPVVDPSAELTALVDATKSDVTIETPAGEVTVSVSAEAEKTPAAPQAVIDKIKAAILAGIDAIGERLAKFRADVEAGKPSPYSAYGTPDAMWDHTYYLQSMIDALYTIGGPQWEIENAADSASVAKGHKSINASRVAKMHAIHKGLSYCMKDFSGLVKELTAEADSELSDESSDSNSTNDTVGKVAKSIESDASEQLKQMVEQLKGTVADQAKRLQTAEETVTKQARQIAQARSVVADSNSLPSIEPTENDANNGPDRGTVIWPADMAPENPGSRKRVRF